MQQRIRFLVALILLVFGFSAVPTLVKAVGVSPSFTIVENMANGLDVERTVSISRSDVSASGYFMVGIGGDAAKYIYLPKNTLTIPEGERSAIFTFHIRPVGAPNGEHKANLIFTGGVDPKAKSASANGVAVISGVIAKVSFTVTDHEVRDLKVTNLAIDNGEVGQPLALSFTLQNLGNVDIAPDKIDVTFVDVTDETNVIKETISASAMARTEPGKTVVVSAPFTQIVPQGEYLATAIFYFAEKEIYRRENLRVFIYPAGTLNQSATFDTFTLNGEKFEVGDLVKLDAAITNNGQISVQPTWYVDVKRNGKSVDVLRHDKKTIGKGATAEYFLTFRPERNGQYEFDAYFEYGIKKTEHKLAKAVVGGGVDKIVWFGIGGVVLVVIGLIAFVIMKRAKRRKE